jgi:F420H(2)-dependent quinone reductase
MVARIAEESERARLWEIIVRRYPVVANYQRKSGREIPVVILRAAIWQDVEGRS